MIKIIGKYKGDLIVKCKEGFYHKQFLSSSGCFICEHMPGESTYFDYLNQEALEEIVDEKVIEKIKKDNPFKKYTSIIVDDFYVDVLICQNKDNTKLFDILIEEIVYEDVSILKAINKTFKTHQKSFINKVETKVWDLFPETEFFATVNGGLSGRYD